MGVFGVKGKSFMGVGIEEGVVGKECGICGLLMVWMLCCKKASCFGVDFLCKGVCEGGRRNR
ncbi:hypothetical protein, partial [Priestia megaterium]|uniref:hypothetical protein n=1 Tax=Priestia megaterium TaxID=1404 RepID=UPI001C995EE5